MNHSSTWFAGSFPFDFFPPLTRDACSFSSISSSTAILGVTTTFFALVLAKILPVFHHLFLDARGWSHRLFGGIHFGLLLIGAVSCWIEATASEYSDIESNENSSIITIRSKLSSSNKAYFALWYDILLGCSGVATTLTAAKDFPHRLVRNKPGRSGSLHKEAIVTQAEMIEHSFYQGLNLLQALYLHALHHLNSYFMNDDTTETTTKMDTNVESPPVIPPSFVMMGSRIFCLWIVSAPWLMRHRFPVHGFSQNWSKGSRTTMVPEPTKAATSKKSITTSIGNHRRKQEHCKKRNSAGDEILGGEIVLYRIKKAQYLFYKHVILHGLNISVALGNDGSSLLLLLLGQKVNSSSPSNHPVIPHGIHWRIFWLLLNTSYSMEFFLQTLVKRRVLSQAYMIVLQKLLMMAASLSAIKVLFGNHTQEAVVRPELCLISMVLNFINRHHDVSNTMGIALTFWFLDSYL